MDILAIPTTFESGSKREGQENFLTVRLMEILWSLFATLFYPVAMRVPDHRNGVKYIDKPTHRTIRTLITWVGYDTNAIKRLQVHMIKDVGAVHYNMYDLRTEKKAAMDR
ncbi:hypothetical protein [Microbulbifer sp. SH-1]|uniref:hypothetical protein n=1 Tax=Microbulbifer sp. SH-1 TaxID=2681547 RepID=UPI001408345F|nr:hypothetical protein [Microbulbifer sp. SH-1]